ncbi:MAG: glycogen debranching protein GlgX [Geminicoccaceae bacterium]
MQHVPDRGNPFPLGATPVAGGVNLAVFSDHAERIQLCLFDLTGAQETARLDVPHLTDGVFHGFFPGLAAGQVYGLRAHGPWAPERGHRFNPHRLLLDPYAKTIVGGFDWSGGNLVDRTDPLRFDPRDTAAIVPKAVVTAPLAATPGPVGTGWPDTILYEAHVGGLTRLHPAVPEELRGTYLGLAHPAVLDHLVRLGVTTVELMPVWAFLDELRLVGLGLRNYWGYNPYAFMAPEPRYALRDPQAEFRTMVKALHRAGLEVVLDVVLNHTAETDQFGPTLSLRGLDNASYYRLDPADPSRYLDWAGCGNSLNLGHPRVLQLAMDALRHWAGLGVDGFRFDLAPALGRVRVGDFRPDAALLQAIAQDPLLGRLKLIAEPWDLGPDGYRQGQFPPPFAMWNDRYRDCVRRFWRGDEAILPELAGRLLGSADLYEAAGRRPWVSVNLVTSHDGFTLADLVSYAGRHNEANGEQNRDGHHDNLSANHGAEGPTGDPEIRHRRAVRQRSLLATLLFSQGTPMLLMGDELGRSQRGNNNAYCQDNALSWLAWPELDDDGRDLLEFARSVVALRRDRALLRQGHFLHGRHIEGLGVPDVTWLAPEGGAMTEAMWQERERRCLGLMLAADDTMSLLLLNGGSRDVEFVLPTLGDWELLVDTFASVPADVPPRSPFRVSAGGLALLAPIRIG